jgi:leucyl-tRNA synthetase
MSFIPESEEKRPGYITADPQSYVALKEYMDELRRNPTPAEALLWHHLRNKQTGHKIRRQHIIGNMIVDFVCLSKKLIIEVDGEIHDKTKLADAFRTLKLGTKGFDVIRFTNEEVLYSPERVVESIKKILDGR